jgi:hypothetical protein
VTLQIVRDWMLRFNEAGPEGLATRAQVSLVGHQAWAGAVPPDQFDPVCALRPKHNT